MHIPKHIPDKVQDHLVTNEIFTLTKHPSLDILVTHPQPNTIELAQYYESDDYISHTDKKKGLLPFLYQTVKKYALQKKVNQISSLHGGVGSLLDIGAGTGDFLKIAQEKGWQIQGVEVNDNARNNASKKGLHLQATLSSFSNTQFDVVTLWHVLEHLPDLEKTVSEIECLVKPGGHLLIAVPNFNSYDAKKYKEFWAAYDVPRHLWHFSQKGIRQLIATHFSLVNTSPMIFDSFYVSLLSEKYKNKRAFSLNAFWVGALSNIKAWRSKEYSSLVYCFKKNA